MSKIMVIEHKNGHKFIVRKIITDKIKDNNFFAHAFLNPTMGLHLKCEGGIKTHIPAKILKDSVIRVLDENPEVEKHIIQII